MSKDLDVISRLIINSARNGNYEYSNNSSKFKKKLNQKESIMSKEKLEETINSIDENEFKKEYENLVNDPNRLKKEFNKMGDNLTESDIKRGAEKFGSTENFLQMLAFYVTFKALLIKKGIKVGVAAGAGAAILFGAGALGNAVASSTGISAIGDISDGLEMGGDIALNIAGVGFDVAENGVDFFGDIIGGIFGFFG